MVVVSRPLPTPHHARDFFAITNLATLSFSSSPISHFKTFLTRVRSFSSKRSQPAPTWRLLESLSVSMLRFKR